MSPTINAPSPEPRELGHGYAMATRSASQPERFHLTFELDEPMQLPNGKTVTIVCSCKGFVYSGKCWHIAFISGEEEEK